MNRSPLKFFLLVFALSIPFWLMQPRDWPISASVGAPLLAALILVYREEGGGPGVRRILSRVFDQWRIRKRIWYVPIIFLMPLLYLLTYGVMRLMGLPVPGRTASFLMIPLLFVLFFILAIGEEVDGICR
jgi:membrane protease YdiL (CAAX protease family)